MCVKLLRTPAICLLLPANADQSFAETIKQITVARNDKLHESWPDLAIAANGDLVVTYQESESHGGGPVSTIVTRVSTDQGAIWGKRTVVAQTRRHPEGWLNCSRIIRLGDHSLLLAIDCEPMNPPDGVNSRRWIYNHAVTWLFRSHDNGRTWAGPEKTSILGVVPSIAQLRDGTLLVGTTRFNARDNWRQHQLVYRSRDNGKTWSEPIVVAEHPRRQPNEGDFVQLETGEVVCYMRDDERGVNNGLKAISRDGGLTWGPLYGSGPWCYAGRPDVGLLSTGEILLTSRAYIGRGGRYLGAYLETQKLALEPTPLEGPVTPGSFSSLIDNDTNPVKPDWGYSGWVELRDGSVYVVQYITADAPPHKPFIRGYRIAQAYFRKSPAQ